MGSPAVIGFVQQSPLLAKGVSKRQAAKELGISERSVYRTVGQ
ncbi:helix-turn-helix domain-containing protein [Aliiruegeria haliotis]